MAKKIRLIYRSSSEFDLSLSDIKDILEASRRNNQAIDVCGMLYFNTDDFLQALEGEEDVVMGLYDRISEDFRHGEVETVSKEDIEAPIFKDWTMGYASISSIPSYNSELQEIASTPISNLSQEQCTMLLKELRSVSE